MKTIFKLFRALIYMIIAILALVFALKNDTLATVSFLLDVEWQAPLSVLMLLSLAVGFFIGFSVGGMSLFRMMRGREKKLKIKYGKVAEKDKTKVAKTAVSTNEQKSDIEVTKTSPATTKLLPNSY